MADLAGVLKELEKERGRLDQVIQVIGSLVGRHRTGIQAKPKRPKRTLSAAARKKICSRKRHDGQRQSGRHKHPG